MVQLHDVDIRTREVLQWKGVHLFHYQGSSCSQKTRIFLRLKNIPWESHYIDLREKEQWQPWYLGINPRGLVPALVLDGEVHIESNDIIALLDRRFPENRLIPEGMEDQIGQLLQQEDDLHLDIRTLNFRFTQPRGIVPRTAEDIRNLREGGSGTVQGARDPERDHQAAFWENVLENGLTDEAVRAALDRFRAALDELEERLEEHPYLLGDDLTILDIAWFIYVMKLLWCGSLPGMRRCWRGPNSPAKSSSIPNSGKRWTSTWPIRRQREPRCWTLPVGREAPCPRPPPGSSRHLTHPSGRVGAPDPGVTVPGSVPAGVS